MDGEPVHDVPVYVGRPNCSGCYWSATMCRHVGYENLLELSLMWLADFDRGVHGIAAQPMGWLGRDGARLRRGIPDFLCRRRTTERPREPGGEGWRVSFAASVLDWSRSRELHGAHADMTAAGKSTRVPQHVDPQFLSTAGRVSPIRAPDPM